MSHMEFSFWVCAVLSCYSYFIYPVLLRMVPERKQQQQDVVPGVLPELVLIITAHNEEQRIAAKLDNSLQLDYPKDRFHIVVASDCSDDGTDRIVESFSNRGVRLVCAKQRLGKENAQLEAIRQSQGELLVFSDVATQIPVDALQKIAARFTDQRVGAVSSEDRFVTRDGQVAGEGAYVRYEMWLRRMESARAGLVGLSGSFFAARRAVCDDWDIHSPSDFNTALNCARHGQVAISAPEVTGIYSDVSDPRLEYRRKLRTVIRGMTAIVRHPGALNPLGTGLFAFQLWSHKLMRWAVPWFLLALFVLTVLLMDNGLVYRLALVLQGIFYAAALAGHVSRRMRGIAPVKIVYFFVQTNIALAHAMLLFLAGRRMTTWTPSRR